jgi:hypothetical protein
VLCLCLLGSYGYRPIREPLLMLDEEHVFIGRDVIRILMVPQATISLVCWGTRGYLCSSTQDWWIWIQPQRKLARSQRAAWMLHNDENKIASWSNSHQQQDEAVGLKREWFLIICKTQIRLSVVCHNCPKSNYSLPFSRTRISIYEHLT